MCVCVFSRAFRVSRVAQLIDWYLAKRKVARLVYVRYILFLSMHSINNIEHNIYKKKLVTDMANVRAVYVRCEFFAIVKT